MSEGESVTELERDAVALCVGEDVRDPLLDSEGVTLEVGVPLELGVRLSVGVVLWLGENVPLCVKDSVGDPEPDELEEPVLEGELDADGLALLLSLL